MRNEVKTEGTKLIAFMNSYTRGISGGDIRFIEVVKRMNHYKKIVVTSLLGERLCESKSLNASYLITTRERNFEKVILTYIKRISEVLFLKIDISEGDILYSTSDFFPDVLPPFLWKLRKKNIKWVALLHSVAPNLFYGPEQKYLNKKKLEFPTLRGFLYKIGQLISIILMRNSADLVLAINSEIKDYLMRKGVAGDKILVVNNGIDFKMVQGVKVSERNKYDGIFVGRFHLQKGIFDLVKIWELVKSRRTNCRLLLIGDGNQHFEDRIRKEIMARKLEANIDLVGIKDGTEKFSLIKSGEVFLFPSLDESWGIVAMEAMACALPVVAYNLPIYAGIYGENILRVPIGDVNQFAKTVIRLLDNEELRRDFGLKGQEFIQKYDWGKIAEKESKILRGIV